MGTQAILKYQIERGVIDEMSAKLINWSVSERLMDILPTYRAHWLSKQAHGWSATHKMKYYWRMIDSMTCPRCDCRKEDMEHVIKCRGKNLDEIWDNGMTNVEAVTITLGIQSSTAQTIQHLVKNWRTSGKNNSAGRIATGGDNRSRTHRLERHY